MAPGENHSPVMDLDTTTSDSSYKPDTDRQCSAPCSGVCSASTVKTEDDFDNEPEETLSERLWGLTEMFPESIRDVTNTITVMTAQGIKTMYSLSRNVVWVVVSSSVILFAPLIFEVERAQMEDIQRTQQKQVLFGPNTAVSGGTGVPMPPMR